MARHRFQFVTISTPTKPGSCDARKSTHSHIMRQAHARKRRLQMQKFQNRLEQGLDFSIFEPFLSRPVLTNTRDPFAALARPLATEEYFLLDHYIRVIVPASVGHCDVFEHPGEHQTEMLREWVGLAITDDSLMAAGVLLSTCRHLLCERPDRVDFRRMALQYKRTCLQTLRQEISSESNLITAKTVAKALALAIDEVKFGESSIARQHMRGVLAMMQFCGGPKPIGLTGLLQRMYDKFVVLLELNGEGDSICSKHELRCHQ